MRTLLPTTMTASLILLASPAWSSPDSSISNSAHDLLKEPLFITDVSTANFAAGLEAKPFVFADPPNATFDSAEVQAIPNRSSFLHAQATDSVTPQTESNPAEKPPAQSAPPEDSPVFKRWQEKIPNVLDEVRNDPSFRTRARLGLSYFPSTYDSLGWNVGVEDIFLGKTRFTLSGDYQATFTGDRKAGGADLRYYLLPLGGYVNLAPVIGYRYLETPRYITDGLNVGARLQFVPSRTGGVDISLTQTWVDPQQSEEVGITKLSFGYALTKQLRISTDIEKQNSKQKKDTRFGISLEWMF